MKLLEIMNSSSFDENGVSSKFGTKFTDEELQFMLKLHSEGKSLDTDEYPKNMRSRWIHFIKCLEKQDSNKDLSVVVATQSISTAFERISNHFSYSEETNTWVINDDATIDEGYESAKEMLKLIKGGEMVIDESSWIIGNIASAIKEKFEEDYDPSFISENMNVKIETVEIYRKTFEMFRGNRVKGVPFSHHKDVIFTKGIDMHNAHLVLEAAAKSNLNLKQTKYLSKITSSRIANGEKFEEITKDDVEMSLTSVVKGVNKKYIIMNKKGKLRPIMGHLSQKTLDTAIMIIETYPSLTTIKFPKS